MKHKLPGLIELQCYQHDGLLEEYCQQFPGISFVASKQLLADLLAWMWLSVHRLNHNKLTYMITPLLPLDKLWHLFILNTRSYVDFCDKYFGYYFHHENTLHTEDGALSLEDFHDFISDCYDYLGEDWVIRNLT